MVCSPYWQPGNKELAWLKAAMEEVPSELLMER